MRRQAGLLAGFDILALEVSCVGDDIDLLSSSIAVKPWND
jgi:hypothetical protein